MNGLRSGYLVLILSILLAQGCGGNPETPGRPASATDDLGRTVQLPRTVERVVSLAPNLTEIVFAAGAGHKVVGVTTVDNYPSAVQALPRFGALPLDIEAIVALEPDLILANDDINNPRDTETFEAVGLPTFFFSFQGLDDVSRSIRAVGSLLGTAAHAEAAADSLEAAIAALRARTGGVETRPNTLFLIGDETLYAFGSESYMHTLIELAGGHSTTGTLDTVRPVLSDEFVLTEKPDVIFGAFGASYDPARLLAHHPTWDIVPAIQTGRVYSLDPDLVLRATPRLLDAAQLMARRLHPDLFEPAGTPAALPETP